MSMYPHNVFKYKNTSHHSLVTFNQLSWCLKAKCSTLKIKHSKGHQGFQYIKDTCNQRHLEVKLYIRYLCNRGEIINVASIR